MFSKNLKIAFRFLFKHREYSLINIFGLTLSLVCVLFISLYIFDELSYDRFHRKADRIYRVIENQTSKDGASATLADVAFRVSTLDVDLPAIERTTKLIALGRANFTTTENENKIYEPFTLTDQGFMDIFDFKVLHGSRDKALSESNTAVVTKSTAERLFGKTDVVNKIILNDRENQQFRITAVVEDFPANSHLQLNMIFSLETYAKEDWYRNDMPNDWSSHDFSTYVLTGENVDCKTLEKSVTTLVNSHREGAAVKSTFSLQPLTDIHFYSADIQGGYAQHPGEVYYLYIFGAVGIFVLLIACINYINLSTSLSITRGKEVGIKKVAGAARHNLIGQFITESNLISFIALFLALFLINILMPAFNAFVNKQLSMDMLWDTNVLLTLVSFTLLIGTLSGSYPAFYLSRFKPALAIKGFSVTGKKSTGLRQGLVVFQFALSIILILATLVAHQQLSFIRNKNLGFQQEKLVVLDINSGLVRKGFETIKNEISKIGVVKDVSVSSRVPGEWKDLPRVGARVEGQETAQGLYLIGADDRFLETFEIELVGGRNFSPDNIADSASFLINETAARQFGWLDPLQENLSIESVNFGATNDALENTFKGKVIGIVKDFHFQSLHQKIEPLVIAHYDNPIQRIDYFSVRLTPGDWQAALKEMDKVLLSVDPAHLIEYNFLDQRLEDFYRADVQRGQIFALAATVSIGLACLGLFSLASFMTEQRTKEIGIRKVLGASVGQIVMMLSGNYLKLVIVGFVLATPIAIWLLGKWLQSFAYRIEIGWGSVGLAGAISLLIALFTVGYKSVRAAWGNPVNSLRNE